MDEANTKFWFYFHSTQNESYLGPENINIYIDVIDSKQMGLFANRDFKLGELVLCEKPFLVVPTFLQSKSTEEILSVADIVTNASKENQDLFFDLSDKCRNDSDVCASILGIIETNGLPMGEEKEGKTPPSAGLYKLMCRMNHSCVPNVHHQFNEVSGSHEIRCITPIKENEEVVANYFYVAGKTFEKRQQLQHSKWNFKCQCKRCLKEKEDAFAREKGNEHEQKLSKLDEEISLFVSLKPEKALSRCEEKISLLKSSDRFYDPIELVRTYFDGFQICLQVEDLLFRAPHFIRQAWLHSVVCRGLNHLKSLWLEKFCVNPLWDNSCGYSESVVKDLGSVSFVRKVKRKFSLV